MNKNQPKNCLVTGATGVVGVPLVRELARRGHRVAILARGEIAENSFPESVRIFRGDITEESALENSAKNAEWIFHLAAKLHISNPDENLTQEYYETNVEATRRLIEIASANNAEKFIFFSTINVYGESQNREVFTEESAANPFGIYAETKADAEKSVLEATNRNGEKIGVVLRLAAVYGSRMKGNYVTLLNALRRDRFFFIGGGKNRRTVIHQTDAARAAIRAAESGSGGEIYNVTDGEVHTFKEIIEAMSKALGKSAPKLHLPVAPFRLGVGVVEDLGKMLGIKPPVNRNLLEKLLEDIAVSGDKIQEKLDFEPEYNLAEGWKETISAIEK